MLYRTDVKMNELKDEELTSKIAERYKKVNYITCYVNDAILIFDENGILKFKNPEADLIYKRLSYNEDILGMSYMNLSLSNVLFKDIISNNSIDIFEVEVAGMCLQIKHIVQRSKDLNLVVIIKDVTDMKQKEKELILKSVAIKEIHHRVKNNLQMIASLLRLQYRRIDSKEFHDAINESINRIISIAVTHEILAKEGIDEVCIKEVINRIKNSMLGFEKEGSLNLNINVLGDDIKLGSDNAISIALVVNELIQNSIKHAFKGREEGEITILVEEGNIYSTIAISDNGIGFGAEEVYNNSLGLMIVRSLVIEKLEGSLNIYSNSEGTKIVFDFKN